MLMPDVLRLLQMALAPDSHRGLLQAFSRSCLPWFHLLQVTTESIKEGGNDKNIVSDNIPYVHLPDANTRDSYRSYDRAICPFQSMNSDGI